jgi:hypothetical protein
MKEAYQLASKKIRDKGLKAKKSYDRWMRSTVLQPGDGVLVRNLSERGGPGKLRSFWERDVHVVIKRKGSDSPVYEVQCESNSGKTRVLHRNLLLPCDYLPAEDENLAVTQQPLLANDEDKGQNPLHCAKVTSLPVTKRSMIW